MKMNRIFGMMSLMGIFLVSCLNISAQSDRVFSWYCVRNKEHRQPLADADMRFIEQYDGYYIDRAHGDSCAEKVIYLTFDAGYENGNVEKILDVLKEEQVSGAFFILSNLIRRNPDLIRRMAEEGHIVANHTAHHKNMTTVDTPEEFQAELEALETLYRETTGREMARYYRPPEGKFDERSLQFAQQLGYQTIFWSLAYADWDNDHQPSPDAAKAKILENIHNGAVLLLHPTSATNAQILGEIIQTLKSNGYRFGTLDELTGNV